MSILAAMNKSVVEKRIETTDAKLVTLFFLIFLIFLSVSGIPAGSPEAPVLTATPTWCSWCRSPRILCRLQGPAQAVLGTALVGPCPPSEPQRSGGTTPSS